MKFHTKYLHSALLCGILLAAGCSDDRSDSSDGIYSQAPVFEAFSPERGKAGDVITITGEYFGSDPSAITVLINSTPAAILSVTDSAIAALVPEECGSGAIRIGLRRNSETGMTDIREGKGRRK